MKESLKEVVRLLKEDSKNLIDTNGAYIFCYCMVALWCLINLLITAGVK